MSWDTFIDDHYSGIYRYCCQFTGNPTEAEDLTQEIFLKAHKSFQTLREQKASKAWIFTIARNTCIDRARWWKRFFRTLNEVEPQQSTEPQENELTITLRKLISELPEKQREVFILRHFHGFSTEETATLLKISDGTVKSHLKRAIDKLRTALESQENSTLLNIQPSESLTTDHSGEASLET